MEAQKYTFTGKMSLLIKKILIFSTEIFQYLVSKPESWLLILIYPRSRISDPGSNRNSYSYLFCSHKFHKTGNYYFIFEQALKKFERIDKKNTGTQYLRHYTI